MLWTDPGITPHARLRRTGYAFPFQHYENFFPDVVLIGKGSQLSAIVVKGNGSNFYKGKEKTTTTNAIRKMKLLHALRFLTGKVPVENAVPAEYFDFHAEGPQMHDIVQTTLQQFWGPRDWNNVWGSGLVWFTTEKTDMKGQANTNKVFWAGLDREEHVRAIFPLRPIVRLAPYLQHWFKPYAGTGGQGKGASGPTGGAPAERRSGGSAAGGGTNSSSSGSDHRSSSGSDHLQRPPAKKNKKG